MSKKRKYLKISSK